MKKSNLFLLWLSAGCLFSACTNDDEVEEPKEERIPVVVKVTEEPMQDENAPNSQQAPTRAAATTTSNLSKFYMEYYAGGYWNLFPFTKSDGVWTSTLSWPDSEAYYPLTFYAYRDNETESSSRLSNSSNPYLSVSVEENASTQHDIIVAKSKSFLYSEMGSVVNLSFKHICSAVQFRICKTSGMSDYNITVKEIKLYNVIKEGNYYYNSDTWDLSKSTTTYYTLYSSDGIEIPSTPSFLKLYYPENDYMFLIPQTLTPWDKSSTLANTYIHLRCKIKKGETFKVGSASEWGDAYLAVGGTWNKGEIHTITLQVGTALRNASGTQITTL